MHASVLPDSPDLAPQAIPVVCDKCRAEGFAGDAIFSAIPDILGFTPVKRRAHVNNWTDEHQRAFIAALAITGSPRQAARAIGRHQFGADSLRNHRLGKSFAAAWDAAMELSREREVMRIHDNLAELAKQRDEQLAKISPSPREGEGWGEGARALQPSRDDDPFPPGYNPEWDTEERLDYLQVKQRIRQRFHAARRIFLACIAKDPAKRAAWEALCGPVDWDVARHFGEQGNEPPHPNVHNPDTQLLAENGFMADIIGGEDRLTPIKRQLAGIDPLPDE